MGSRLPDLDLEAFTRRLEPLAPEGLSDELAARLFRHYRELRLWNRRISLVGPGTRDELVERHYGESLAALSLLPPETGTLVDVGSGAGFPGLVLAAARPEMRVVLVESNGRKEAFLRSAAGAAGLSCEVLGARVSRTLPAGFPARADAVTIRAVRLEPKALAAIAERLADGGRFLFWVARDEPVGPAGFVNSREVGLAGGTHRRIVELSRA